jgi:membrane protein required for colicin V production
VDLSLNFADIAVVGVLLLSALVAFSLGFSRTVLYFAAWGIAIYAAWRFYPLGTPYAQKYLPEQVAEGAAAFVIFLGVLLVCWLIAHLITRGIRRSVFRTVDRLLGLVLGLGIGGIIVCVAYLVVAWATPIDARPQWLLEARTLPYVETGTKYLQAVLPEDLVQRTALVADEAKRRLQEGSDAEHRAAVTTGGTDAAPSGQPEQPGYSDSERQQLDRALEGSGQQ